MTPAGKPTILIADDNAGQRKVLELVLSAHNYQVVSAEDGKEALAYLRENTPDLIILDVNMPFASGIEICRRIRHVARLQQVPVIIMTSLTDAAIKQEALEARADLVLHKPFSGQDLRGVIGGLLNPPGAALLPEGP